MFRRICSGWKKTKQVRWNHHSVVQLKKNMFRRICSGWKKTKQRYSWRNSSGLKINNYWKFFSQTKYFTHDWQFHVFFDNTLHQNDGTWSPLLLRRSPGVGLVRGGICAISKKPSESDGMPPNTMNRDEGALSLILFWPRLFPVIVGTDEVIKYHHSDEMCCSRTQKTVNRICFVLFC